MRLVSHNASSGHRTIRRADHGPKIHHRLVEAARATRQELASTIGAGTSKAIDLPPLKRHRLQSENLGIDGATYSNGCLAAAGLRGQPVLDIDEGDRVIYILFDGVFSTDCPTVYDPATGAHGDFGALAAGNWTFYNSHGGSLDFTVVPEPASLILLASGVIAFLAYGWRRSTRTVPTTANIAATIVEYGSQP